MDIGRNISIFDLINNEIEKGIAGKNFGIPMAFKRLNQHIGIRKRIYTLIFGATGTGKSAFCHSTYILDPFEYYIKNKDTLKFKVFLFAMERSKVYTLAKWLSRKIFIDQGILIPIPKMLGWWDSKLDLNEKNLIDMYEDYINELCSVVDIIEGGQNPTGIRNYVREYANKNGKVEEIDEYHKIYIPNHENEIVIPIVDHNGLLRTEKNINNKKEAIDKVSGDFQYMRDFYGYSPVAVSQVNRDLSNPLYQKQDSIEPNLDQIKESGRPSEDSEVVISLFQPSRYKTNDNSYDVQKFIDKETGNDYFRSIKILKNSYGASDIKIGMAFEGVTGTFKELYKKAQMENFNYDNLFNKLYFVT